MKQIFLSLQSRLAALVPSLRHIDRNWGQLNLPQPNIQFPCALIDILAIDYSPIARNSRLASASLSIIVAHQHSLRSSASALAARDPSYNPYPIFDTIRDIVLALQGFSVPGATQALVQTSLQKTFSDSSYDVFSLSFSTAWVELIQQEGETVSASPSVSVRPPSPV